MSGAFDVIEARLREATQALAAIPEVAELVGAAAQLLDEALRAGGTVLVCGNGGSAAAAQHFAAELVGRFKRERAPFPAIALNADTATLTALANDYGYANVFARQVRALGRPGDVLLLLTTSGRSENIVRAAEQARESDIRVLALTGAAETSLAALCDVRVAMPSLETTRIQEMHLIAAHIICETVEDLASEDAPRSSRRPAQPSC